MLKYTCNLGKLKKNLELSRALAENGLLSALPFQTEKGEDFLREGEVYFYLTRRLPGKQMVSHSMEAKDGRFVGEILGRLHLALRNIDDCVSEADLMATLQDWALPRAKTAMDLSEQFCREYLDAFAALYPALPRQLIHRDPNPGNILRADNQWGFVDFELAERNARIYDPCYAATAVLSESFPDRKESWLGLYREIICGYDSVAKLTAEERYAIPYILLANQLVCVAWFAEQDQYAELFETNRKMTGWLLEHFEELKDI